MSSKARKTDFTAAMQTYYEFQNMVCMELIATDRLLEFEARLPKLLPAADMQIERCGKLLDRLFKMQITLGILPRAADETGSAPHENFTHLLKEHHPSKAEK